MQGLIDWGPSSLPWKVAVSWLGERRQWWSRHQLWCQKTPSLRQPGPRWTCSTTGLLRRGPTQVRRWRRREESTTRKKHFRCQILWGEGDLGTCLDGKVSVDFAAQRLKCCTGKLVGSAIPTYIYYWVKFGCDRRSGRRHDSEVEIN